MSVTGIQSSQDLTSIYAALKINSTSSTDDSSSVGSVSQSTSDADSVDFSKPSQLYSKLQQLQETDPEKFKEVCASIAEKLRDAAGESSGSNGNNMLSDLADKFESVANGGDISQLKPPEPPSFNATGIEAYTQQSNSAPPPPPPDQSGSGTSMDDLLSDFIDEVDSALSGYSDD